MYELKQLVGTSLRDQTVIGIVPILPDIGEALVLYTDARDLPDGVRYIRTSPVVRMRNTADAIIYETENGSQYQLTPLVVM